MIVLGLERLDIFDQRESSMKETVRGVLNNADWGNACFLKENCIKK